MPAIFKNFSVENINARSNSRYTLATVGGADLAPSKKYLLLFSGTSNTTNNNSVVSYLRLHYDGAPAGLSDVDIVSGGWEGNSNFVFPVAQNSPMAACTMFTVPAGHTSACSFKITMWQGTTVDRPMAANGFLLLIDVSSLIENVDYWYRGYTGASPDSTVQAYVGSSLTFTAPATGTYIGFSGGTAKRDALSGSSTTDLMLSANVFDGIGGVKLNARHEYEDGTVESMGVMAAASATLNSGTSYTISTTFGTSDNTKSTAQLNSFGSVIFAPNKAMELKQYQVRRNVAPVKTLTTSTFPDVTGDEFVVFSGFTVAVTGGYAYSKSALVRGTTQIGLSSEPIGLSVSNTADVFGATSAGYYLGTGGAAIAGKLTYNYDASAASTSSCNLMCVRLIPPPTVVYKDLQPVANITIASELSALVLKHLDVQLNCTIDLSAVITADYYVDLGIPITIATTITVGTTASANVWLPLVDLSNLTFEHSVGNVNPPLADMRNTEKYSYTTHSAATLHVEIEAVTGYTPAVIAMERYYSNFMTVVGMQRWYELQAADVVRLYRAYGIKTTENIQTVSLYREYDIEVGAAAPIELRMTRHYSVFNPAFETRLLQLINEERDRVGVAGHVQKFSMYDTSENISQLHCVHMAVVDEYNHDSTAFPIGYQTAYERMDRLAPYYTRGAENTAIVHALPLLEDLNLLVSPDYFYESWRNSSGHYGNMVFDWEGYTGVEGVEAEIQLGLHAYARDHLKDTYHGTYTDYRPYVNYLCFANHNFLLSPRDTAVATVLKMQRQYALQAPTVVSLYRGYELGAYAHVALSFLSTYTQDVRLSFESSYSSLLALSFEAPYGVQIGVSLEAPYGGTVQAALSVGASYDIEAGNKVAMSLESTYGQTIGVSFLSLYEDTAKAKLSFLSEYDRSQTLMKSISSLYSDMDSVVLSVEAINGDMSVAASSFISEYAVTPQVAMSLEAINGDMNLAALSFVSEYAITPQVVLSVEAINGDMPPVKLSLEATNGDMNLAASSFVSEYEVTPQVAMSVQAPYGLNTVVTKSVEAGYEYNTGIALSLLSEYAGSDVLSLGFESVYDLNLYNQVRASISSYYDLVNASSNISTGRAQINFGGQSYAVDTVEIGISEGDAYWSGSITPASRELFHRLTRGTVFTLDMFGTQYLLVVEGRTSSRAEVVSRAMSVQVSTVASLRGRRLASTVSYTNTEPVMASELAAHVLGAPIDWIMIDWSIPAYRYAIEAASPIEAAKAVIEAAGGVLTSNPQGGFIALPKHKVSVRNYDGNQDVTISDAENNISQNESPDFVDVKNRFRISEAVSTFSDKIEYVPTELNDETMNYGELRVYPSPWRTGLQVRTTSGANVPLSFVGVKVREEEQIVEFTKGDASLSYPIEAIIEVEWLSQPTGGIVHEKYATNLTTGTNVNEGYGLAKIKYTTASIVYNTTLPIDTEIQFIVEEV